MSKEAYSYLRSMAAMYIEGREKYHKGIVVGYLLALKDADIITTKCYHDWCDYMDGMVGANYLTYW